MARENITELPLYPEERSKRRPATEQILRLFSLVQRHTLLKNGRPLQLFEPQLTDLQEETLRLLGVPLTAYHQPKQIRRNG